MESKNDNLQFKVGQSVVVKNSLVVNAKYSNNQSDVSEVFSHRMKEYRGLTATIVDIEDGKYYKLGIDSNRLHRFTDAMLEPYLGVENEYVLNEDVESLLNHVLKEVPQQRINQALTDRDEKKFKELCNEQNQGEKELS